MSSGRGGGRHPSHLKGREIGLWYSKRRKTQGDGEKTKEKRTFKLGSIQLSQDKVNRIMDRLQKGEELVQKLSNMDDRWNHFQALFHQNISGSIIEKMEVTKCKLIKDEKLDDIYYSELQEQVNNSARFQKMLSARQRLPSYKMKEEIVSVVQENQVCVISGDTGCGKTTQVAQFILEDHIKRKNGSVCKIVCTQPRRISAISVAERVADERAERIGKSVGYQIRLEHILPRQTASILYCTTGIVLKKMEDDPCLSDVSHLILDEIHERDIMSDFILALMKQVLTYRKDLKIILMSATLNSEQFSRYFGQCHLLKIPGNTFPVEEYFLEDVIEKINFKFKRPERHCKWDEREYKEYIEPYIRKLESDRKYTRNTFVQLRNPQSEILDLELIKELVMHICKEDKSNGAILVFVTGYSEISTLYTDLNKCLNKSQNLIIGLHSLMPSAEQKQIFKKPEGGKRKIIIATNIAETSVTIDDVIFVIDSGKIKYQNFNLENNTNNLNVNWVGQANALQRKGRAGRVQKGYCFHLFTKIRYELLEKFLKPEILRSRLENVILQIKILQLGSTNTFLNSLIDIPDQKLIELSLELLNKINALDLNENLTPLGYHLAKLPVAPQMGKMLLMGVLFGCLDPILSVITCLDYKDPFVLPLGKEKVVDKIKMNFSGGHKSDHVVFMNVLDEFEGSYDKRAFCWDNFLSQSTLNTLVNMKKQFMDYLRDMNFASDSNSKSGVCNKNSENVALIKAVVCAGLFPNIVVLRQRGKFCKMTLLTGQTVKPHPKSIMGMHNYFEEPLLVYYHKLKSTADFFHDGTMINKLPVLFFSDICGYDKDQRLLSIGDRASFMCNPEVAEMIIQLRKRLNWFLEYKAAKPGVVNWEENSVECELLRPILDLILSEDLGQMFDSDGEY